MGSEWSNTTIGEQITLQRGFDITRKEQRPGKVPVISSGGISSYHDIAKQSGPGVVMGRKGSLGTVFYVEDDYWPHDTTLWIKDFHGNDERFAYYFFKNIAPQLLDMDVGAANPTLNRNHVHPIEIRWPSLPEQKAIAHILGTLDDKIELNRRMNATLEGMAQALFKSWFVDFDPVIDNALAAGNPIPDELAPRARLRQGYAGQAEVRRLALANGTPNRDAAKNFPAAFQETESMSWIPEGWEVKRADEIADVSIGKTPPRKESHWFSNDSDGNVTWVSIRDMGSCGAFIGDSNEYLIQESVDKFNVKVIPEGSVLLSFKLTVGRVSITQNQMATNEAIAHFVNPKFGLMKEFVYSYLKAFDFSNLGSTSSIATAVNSKIIKAMPFLVPNGEVLECFEKAAGHWFNAISINIVQTNNLTKLRDTLLPKLISGELRLPEAENLFEEALA